MVKSDRGPESHQSGQPGAGLLLEVAIGKKTAHLISNPNDLGVSALFLNVADDCRDVLLDYIIQGPALSATFQRIKTPARASQGEVPHVKPFFGQILRQALFFIEIKKKAVDEEAMDEDYGRLDSRLFSNTSPLQGELQFFFRYGPVLLSINRCTLACQDNRNRKENGNEEKDEKGLKPNRA